MARNTLPFEYQMRGQQMQYLNGDLLAHAIDQRDRDLEDFLGQRTAWTPLTLLNGWFTDSRTARYRKIGDVVYVEGVVFPGTVDTVAVLPVGFRPQVDRAFVTWHGLAGGTATALGVLADGRITSVVANSWAFLDGTVFSVMP